jgi:WD40 repeat protein
MKKSNYTLFLSLGILIVTTIIVALFGVVPLPEYEVLTNDVVLKGKLIFHVEIQNQNLIPPAPDIMDECILSIDLSAKTFKEEKIICGSDLYDLSYDIYFYDAQIIEEENILLRYWDETSGNEMGLIINIDSGVVVDRIKEPSPSRESHNMNVYGEKLIEPWETSDYSSRVIGVYYVNGTETVEVFKSKAPTSYYFESLNWSPDGDYIAALDSENNLIIFSKNKKFKPVIVTYSKLNLEIFDDEERRLINLISWTD